MVVYRNLPVAYSLFSSEGIAELVAKHYDLPEPIHCQLLQIGNKDYYRIKAGSEEYALRIHRAQYGSQSESNYGFEVDWLRYLKEKRCLVSCPIPRKDGSFIGSLEAPEGRRYFLLFSFAEGVPSPLSRKRAFLLGKEIARIHLISAKFKTLHERPPIDLHFLLEEPILEIKKFLSTAYIEEQERLEELANQLKEKILSLLSFKEKDWGLIGGDFDGSNQHFLESHRFTLFNFDSCGYGWRAYDLAVFRWKQLSDLSVGTSALQAWWKGRFFKWKYFLSGYQSIRPLSAAEQAAIPLLVQVRQIWSMGTYAKSPHPLVPMDEAWWKRNFQRLFKPFQ